MPGKLFTDSTSTVLLDRNGVLLGAKIAGDGQWRFQQSEQIPEKFESCLIEFEDRRFYSHFGISLKGIGRAVIQNYKKKQDCKWGKYNQYATGTNHEKKPGQNIPGKNPGDDTCHQA